jgi:hypothetical protein
MITQNNWQYVHIPRTAGTHAEQLFLTRHGLDITHSQHAIIGDESITQQKFRFGFVRNPYAQEYSSWELHCVDTDWPRITFEDWVLWRYVDPVIAKTYDFSAVPDNETYGRLFNINPSAGYFCDYSGVCCASKIYRYEELQSSWADISVHIGLDMNFPINSISERYKSAYTNRIFDIITEHRHTDLELFGYGFDNYTGDCSINYEIGPIKQQNYYMTREFYGK